MLGWTSEGLIVQISVSLQDKRDGKRHGQGNTCQTLEALLSSKEVDATYDRGRRVLD